MIGTNRSLAAIVGLVGLALTGTFTTPSVAASATDDQVVAADPSPRPVHAQRAGTYRLKLVRATAGNVVSGTTVRFAGKGPRRLKGRKVFLQRRVGGGKWVKVSSSRIRKGGRFTLKGLATGQATNRWVAYTKNYRQVSAPVSHKVFSWYAMTSENAVDWDSFYWADGPADIGAEHFADSVTVDFDYSGDTYVTEWNLSYKCVTFEGAYGMENSSGSSMRSRFWAIRDGVAEPAAELGIGPAGRVSLDVTSRMRIGLAVNPDEYVDEQAYPTWAGLRVLCDDDPF